MADSLNFVDLGFSTFSPSTGEAYSFPSAVSTLCVFPFSESLLWWEELELLDKTGLTFLLRPLLEGAAFGHSLVGHSLSHLPLEALSSSEDELEPLELEELDLDTDLLFCLSDASLLTSLPLEEEAELLELFDIDMLLFRCI